MPKFRPGQQKVLQYTGGTMGVSAVPGSGKTHTLASLAAKLIIDGRLEEGQEVLVVTLTNSAVSNFNQRIRKFLEESGHLGSFGYRVRTLHGLAHDIVRERPGLVGLADDFSIVDERAAEDIFSRVVETWVVSHPEMLDAYCKQDILPEQRPTILKGVWSGLVRDMSRNFTRKAKDLQATPATIQARLQAIGAELPLVTMCNEIYRLYQQALRYRGAVDFDDLIRLAYQALSLDEAFLFRLQARWPFILEDEAQDSNQQQQRILEMLSAKHGNWVRVGDSNQAIFETFTNASPRYLREFVKQAQYAPNLLNSGRSTQSIMQLANYLVEWTLIQHPKLSLREDTFTNTPIFPVGQDDGQQNPEDQPDKIFLYTKGFSPEVEKRIVARSVKKWLEENPEGTVVVLVGTNSRGAEFVKQLEDAGVKVVEILRTSHNTRKTAALLRDIFFYLYGPENTNALEKIYQEWCRTREERQGEEIDPVIGWRVINSCRQNLERFFWPDDLSSDWLDEQTLVKANLGLRQHLQQFREMIQRWQQAVLLPVDQLVLTISQDIHSKPADLALDYKLAVVLGNLARMHPDWHLARLGKELDLITKTKLKLDGFSEDGAGFDPDTHKGEVVVATVHKAKGLEWDRVYLTSANNYDYPSLGENDVYIAEKWFIRDQRNLEAEVLLQLEGILEGDVNKWHADWQDVLQQARVEYARERLRLMYVAITRAKKELVITWNTGKKDDCTEAKPFSALVGFWEKECGHAAA